ncbi:MAG: tetrathionate reductase family octaheme c-type cytochrome [Chloroflexota bacterium]
MEHSSRFLYKLAFALALPLVLAGLLVQQSVSAQPELQGALSIPAQAQAVVDHTKLPELQGPFATPQDVTKACLSCHANAADEIMHTTHWTWEYVNEETGQTLGKKTLINNFCISVQSNEPRCTSCHVGYGWKDDSFDFAARENVDCLVCHDTTGAYKKFPTGAGLPVSEPKEFPAGSGTMWNPPDLANIAQNVGLTSRKTCGTCHFFGGGGDEVKHGDLDSSLNNPAFELDVHMSAEGQNFTCTTCHTSENHDIAGSRYSMSAEEKGCENCHGSSPHAMSTLNDHAQKVACQTCHIPEFARGGIATKMTWDWSKAGELADGKPVVRKDEHGHVIYDGQKGEFTYAADVIPEYVWFNGQVVYTLANDVIDPTQVVNINQFMGSKEDPNARIWPVKRFEAVQPYDSGNNTLVIPHLFGKDEFAYWGNYDWGKAIEFGMEYAELPYSGEYGFVKSQMYWPITHMVAPASDALACQDCHTAENGRLDFAALGYSSDDVARLKVFPPVSTQAGLINPKMAPDACLACHEGQHTLWAESLHSEKGVGCVACHKLESEGEHPAVPMTVEKTIETCGNCHIQQYEELRASRHGEVGLNCNDCHNPHSQQLMTVGENTTACVNCHKAEAEDVMHSTHTREGLDCASCHLNPDNGHAFAVSLSTCNSCHEDIHSASVLSGAGEAVQPAEQPAPSAEDHGAAESAPVEGGIQLPVWTGWVAALLLGGLVSWAVFGREPGGPVGK